jgi:uncharacterized protein YggE
MESFMRLLVLALLTCLASGRTALAQACAPPHLPNGPPLLRLSETSTVKIEPTILVADLVADEQSRTAVSAQRQVNDLMAKVQAIAGRTRDVTAIFEDYETDFVDAANGVSTHWEASQTLEVSGHSGEVILGLVGQMQALGLTLGNLGWQVPQDQADAAGRKARLAALASLRAEAAQAAQTLGLSVGGYQSIDLTGGPTSIFNQRKGGPVPQMAAETAPPLASTDAQDITATVSADVVLAQATVPSPKAQP